MTNTRAYPESLVARLSETGKRLWQTSLPEYLMNSPDLNAALTYMKYWALNYNEIGKFGIECAVRLGPVGAIRMIINSPWLLTLL
ncbi:MAG: hypothetical protein CVU53_06615, partial [Deltaproteobacteria bacterium HGW-Deltaproteobacteria-11]